MLPATVAHEVQSTLLDYLRTTFHFQDKALEAALVAFMQHPEQGLFRGPYLDLRLPFRKAAANARIPLDMKPGFAPYAHQLRAWERLSTQGARRPESTLVTTGTGSGKTECFLYPLLDHCARAAEREERGIKAIVLYPMNALASDQATRLAKLLHEHPKLKDVTAGLYVGGHGEHRTSGADFLVDDRTALRDSPPDILLTNYKMLDYLLLRPEDRALFRFNGPDTLRYVVLDELHSYDGAQGSDVACLLRRLRARLGMGPGALTCVGTSATLGGGGSGAELRKFAGDIFQVPLGEDCLVREDRLSLSEAFPPTGVEETITEIDAIDADPGELYAKNEREAATFFERQCTLWLGYVPHDSVELGRALGRHYFLRRLLEALQGRGKGPHLWTDIAARLTLSEPRFEALSPERQWLVLSSFLSLIARARRLDGEQVRPFLDLQVTLWVRELRGVVRKVEPTGYTFAWRDELKPDRTVHYGPVVYCRDCGVAGFGALAREGSSRLLLDSRRVGEAFMQRNRLARFVVLGDKRVLDGQREVRSSVCPVCLDYADAHDKPVCLHGLDKVQTLAAVAYAKVNAETDKFVPTCPRCDATDSLMLLGARAATLSSIAITQIFQSRFHGDVPEESRKLLAFTDSVQDASHRAGFFGGRTYRFSVRTAIQGIVQSAAAPIPVPEVAQRVLAHFGERIGQAKTIATFLPPDLREADAYVAYRAQLQAGKAPDPTVSHDALELVRERLGWEVTYEYGLGVTAGRSLDATACSSVGFDEARVAVAVARISELLRQEFEHDVKGGVDEADVRHFIEAILHRLRVRGGVLHPFLLEYVKEGRRFYLSKYRQPMLSPFARDAPPPRFLYEGTEHKIFDTLFSRGNQRTWFRDFCHRALRIPRDYANIDDVLRRTLQHLRRAGLIERVPSGQGYAIGLVPEAMLATADVAVVRCAVCGNRVTLPRSMAERWGVSRCTRHLCLGYFEPAERLDPEQDYYGRLYRAGRVERIFTSEHTGLLERATREALEREFKAGKAPDAPNLLTCTPTLEMGIDIGDLSSVMLCAVPPGASNYQQRVGRAGRSSGNALVTAVARSHPHDQFFHQQPEAMMRAEVRSPGCFLDAPEMLIRQMTAHAIDQWAREDVEVTSIPNKMRFLAGAKNQRGFPTAFYNYYGPRRDALTQSFLALFPDMSERARTRLQELGAASVVADRIREGFAQVDRECRRLLAEIDLLRKRREALEAQPDSVPPDAEEPDVNIFHVADRTKAELEDAIRAHRRSLAHLRNKHPLNVLTDAGVLPNYAFPEPGVSLQAVLLAKKRKGALHQSAADKKHFEYLRPASSALREFAPFNTFYAEGHRVTVSRVDVGTRARPTIELWRFCPSCPHSEQLLDGSVTPPKCPICGDTHYPDPGQLKRVVPFRQAFSSMDLMHAATADESEERDERRYRVLDLVEVEPANWGGARLIEGAESRFGYELLRGPRFRQFNFGLVEQTDGSEAVIASQKVTQAGFKVCEHCGQVQRDRDVPEHVPFCPVKAGKAKAAMVDIVLSREMRSEALRFLVPTVSYAGREQVLPTLRAALQLGFRELFGGQAAHVRYTSMSEPAGEQRRHFLVAYDAVPGGTGYLAELWDNGARFVELLQRALAVITRCGCDDGCYHCLYGYQDARQLPNISRGLAVRLLEDTVAHAQTMTSLTTLSELAPDLIGESELEHRFIEALSAHIYDTELGELTTSQWQGKKEWRLRVRDRHYRIVPQVDLTPSQGVAVWCRPDFVIYPVAAEEGVKPIAVFCDGLKYHVKPGEQEGGLADDTEKRRAIVASEQYRVWSVTWKDVRVFAERSGLVPTLLPKVNQELAVALLKWNATPEDVNLRDLDNMSLLLRLLIAPDPNRWSLRAVLLLAARALVPSSSAPSPDVDRASLSAKIPPNDVLTNVQATLRLDDDAAHRKLESFESSWRAWLQAWNVLQFWKRPPNVWTGEWLAEHGMDVAPSFAPPAPQPVSEHPSTGALEQELPEARALLAAVTTKQLPLPELEHRLLGENGAILCEAILHFRDARLVLAFDLTERQRSHWQEAGYAALDADAAFQDPALVTSILSPKR